MHTWFSGDFLFFICHKLQPTTTTCTNRLVWLENVQIDSKNYKNLLRSIQPARNTLFTFICIHNLMMPWCFDCAGRLWSSFLLLNDFQGGQLPWLFSMFLLAKFQYQSCKALRNDPICLHWLDKIASWPHLECTFNLTQFLVSSLVLNNGHTEVIAMDNAPSGASLIHIFKSNVSFAKATTALPFAICER